MKRIDCIQGSTEWLAARAGIPTASCFDQIITPRTGKVSASSAKYMHKLLAERLLGRPILEQNVTAWMTRGSEMEAEAVAFYEAMRETDTVKVGFLTNDAGTIGASPDRLVGDDGLLEIKCHKEEVHVGFLLTHEAPEMHKPQVQGQLWIGERKWCDVLCYHPELPPCIVRVERDEEFVAILSSAVEAFARLLGEATEVARGNGWIK